MLLALLGLTPIGSLDSWGIISFIWFGLLCFCAVGADMSLFTSLVACGILMPACVGLVFLLITIFSLLNKSHSRSINN